MEKSNLRDEMVLEAQKWVNATYSGHAGYVATPEDGKTGWPTMHSLIMGLQVELGISSLSPNFGDQTLTALENQYPRIGIGFNKNINIVKIIQSAMYCKGYYGSETGISGIYDTTTENQISKLLNDMTGTNHTGVVEPKTFKALLTMDAYVLLAGGSNKIRDIQQWMNNTYIVRKNFFYMPCDGHFSRDVQTSLLFAIQYELGMDDNTANGVFGPGTQVGLKQHHMKEGDRDTTDNFVHLFKAGHIFNNRPTGVVFNGIYDSTLTGEVKTFQKFAKIIVNGEGDYDTWCEYLVSTGNPDRMTTAIDCSANKVTDERAKLFKSMGIDTIGRYLKNVEGSSFDKELALDEMHRIFRYGFSIFPIMQLYGGQYEYFTYAEGVNNAKIAMDRAKNYYGFPSGTVIYFAVDYDAQEEEIRGGVTQFFKGINDTLEHYVVGVYGSRNVCSIISEQELAQHSFVSGMSTGYSGNLGFTLPKNWSFNQIREDDNLEIDHDVMRGTDKGVNYVNSTSKAIWNLESFSTLAGAYGKFVDDKNYLGYDAPNGKQVIKFKKHGKDNPYFGEQIVVSDGSSWYLLRDDDYTLFFVPRDDIGDYVEGQGEHEVSSVPFTNKGSGYINPVKELIDIDNFSVIGYEGFDAPISGNQRVRNYFDEGGLYWAQRAYPANPDGRQYWVCTDDKGLISFIRTKII